MSDGPWIKFYPSDWLTGTRGLSPVETGIYITIIAMMYEKGAPLPGDVAKLARLCNCPLTAFKKALDHLVEDGKIHRNDDGTLTNRRVEEELCTRQRASDASSRAAKVRWQKDEENQSLVDADAMRQASHARTGQISDTRAQKLEVLEPDLLLPTSQTDRSNQEDNPVGALSLKAAPAARGTRLDPSWVLPRGWGEWALSKFPGITPAFIREEADKFRDFWIAKATDATKRDWEATWRTWMRRAASDQNSPRGSPRGGRETVVERRKRELAERIKNEHGIGREGNGDNETAGHVAGLLVDGRPV